MMFLTVALLGLPLSILASGTYEPDKVDSVPGVDFPLNFDQYSGFLDASSDGNLQFHYWFLESQGEPSSDPVILWLNGGPGCSSIDGMLEENGAFLINDDGVTMRENEYSWNKLGNVLYLESPSCVGYSYAKDGSCSSSDDSTAAANLYALESFFSKFPAFATQDFYITGESYGGVYLPTLALQIIESNSTLKDRFKGMAVGNGLLSYYLNYNSLINFGYGHGLFSDLLWKKLSFHCCDRNLTDCDYFQLKKPLCVEALTQAMVDINTPDLDPYNIYAQCWHPDTSKTTSKSKGAVEKRKRAIEIMFHPLMKGYGLSSDVIVGDTGIPCSNVTAAETYMNQQSVRTATHVPDSVTQEWLVCDPIDYTSQYFDMKGVFDQIMAKSDLQILLYHGDIDAVCNFMGGFDFVEELGLKSTSGWNSWLIQGSQQIGGWWQSFGDKFQFTTVRGAGHEVPEYRPAAALSMLNSFLKNDYSS